MGNHYARIARFPKVGLVRILPVRTRCGERQVYGYGETSEILVVLDI